MPKQQVTDLITDQEMAFARLVLSGTITDRQAAEAAGLNPDTAAYTKAKPRVRAYMLEHRAAVQQLLVQQEAEGLRRQSISRERVLTRLWEIADLSPEMTRSSITGQVKALAMIVAIEGFIPDRAGKPSAEPRTKPNTHRPSWLPGEQQDPTAPHPSPDRVPLQEGPAMPDLPPTPGPASVANEYNFAHLSEKLSATVPDPTAAFSIKKEPYVRSYGPF